eukprot:Hpha_TRINITY_DN15186_c3_g10::TRINITY_DN15186_c3_g10_i1::g.128701::m.128701
MELGGHQTIHIKGAGAALLYNNLSATEACAAYVSKNDIVFADITRPEAPQISHPQAQTQGDAKTTIHQVKISRIGSRLLMFVVRTSTLQVWDAEKESLVASYTSPNEDVLFMSRGLGILPGKGDDAAIFMGHSNGHISVVDFSGADLKLVKSLARHADNISDICAGEADGCGGVIASADIAGELVLWSEDLTECGKAAFPGDTITSVHIAGSFVVAGFGSGLIRLYNAKSLSVFAQIAAHARWITALAVAPTRNLIASVSEDMLLCIWRLPCKENGGKVQLVGHKLVPDCVLTGVQFLDGGKRVLANAYDWDRLHALDVTV